MAGRYLFDSGLGLNYERKINNEKKKTTNKQNKKNKNQLNVNAECDSSIKDKVNLCDKQTN